MKRVFSSLDSVAVGLRESVLEAAEISHEVRNVTVSELAGPSLIAPLELWVGDEDYDSAVRLLAESAIDGDSGTGPGDELGNRPDGAELSGGPRR